MTHSTSLGAYLRMTNRFYSVMNVQCRMRLHQPGEQINEPSVLSDNVWWDKKHIETSNLPCLVLNLAQLIVQLLFEKGMCRVWDKDESHFLRDPWSFLGFIPRDVPLLRKSDNYLLVAICLHYSYIPTSTLLWECFWSLTSVNTSLCDAMEVNGFIRAHRCPA